MNKTSYKILGIALVFLVAVSLHYFGLYDALYDALELKTGADENFVAFLSVGQADCTLVHANGEYILIDTGANRDDGILITKKLLSYGVRKIRAIILSHDHTDHAGGLHGILSEFEVGGIICPNGALRGDDEFTKDILSVAESTETELISAVVGDSVNFSDAKFDFLWLDERIDENDSCLVLMLTLNGKRFFFGGDISKFVEKRMITDGVNVECDVMKASHHGSKSSNSELFLDAAKPEYCVAMCGENNFYKFPTEEFKERINSRKIKLFVTAEHGDVVFDLTNGKISTKK